MLLTTSIRSDKEKHSLRNKNAIKIDQIQFIFFLHYLFVLLLIIIIIIWRAYKQILTFYILKILKI